MNDNKHLNPARLAQSQAVVSARLIREGTGDKFIWDTVQVLKVLHNTSGYSFGGSLAIARYSATIGLRCNGSFTLYLTPYPFGSARLNERSEWMMIQGDPEKAAVCDEDTPHTPEKDR